MNLEITRRDLLKKLGGGILVLTLGPLSLAQRRGGQQTPQEISGWLHIAPGGKITILTGKVEVGQNARTSLTQAAAEELRVPVDRITIIMGDTDLVPFDMGTFGSRTTPTMVPQIRKAAAAARETLREIAAKKWNVDGNTLKFENGAVVNGQHSAGYGELAKDQPFDRPIGDVELTDADEWKVLGTSVPKVGGRAVVTGKHEYTADVSRPGMVHAKVLRAPSLGAKLKSVEIPPGVEHVRDGDFIAVVASTVRQANKSLWSLRAEWEEGRSHPTHATVHSLLRGPGNPQTQPSGDKSLTGTYQCAYIAHVPLEPRAALAEWDGSKMTVYTGTQRPFGVRDEVAEALKLPQEKVRVIVPDTGSGYGGKHSGDAAVEAARIAYALKKPVKLVWTREEEFTHAYFRPGGVADLASGVSNDGVLTSWQHDIYNAGGSGLRSPYETPAKREQSHRSDSPLRQGSYRALASTFNNFAREVHIDELAHELKIDPVEFRLKNLKEPRLRAVLEEAAKKFEWGKSKPEANRGYGIACGTEKGSYVATAVEVAIDEYTNEITVPRAVVAYECGAILNPALLLQQVEGAVIQGLGGALFEEIQFEEGKILSNQLSKYRVPRIFDVPQLEVVLMDRKDLASAGAGETPIIAIAPAISSAVFMATGTRLRSMPMRL